MSREVAIPDSPKAEELKQEVAPIVELANSITIDSPLMYSEAAEELKAIKAKSKTLEDRRKAITTPLDAAKKSVMDLFRAPLAALEEAERIFKRKMITFDDEQRRRAAEEARQREEAALRERQRLEREAEEARASGDEATAAVLEHTADVVTAAPATIAPAAAQGIARTVRWSAEVEDKEAFIRHCLTPEGAQYLDALVVDMRPLNQLATALKERMNVPGIKAVSTAGISARS
jgi:hypothetical protein